MPANTSLGITLSELNGSYAFAILIKVFSVGYVSYLLLWIVHALLFSKLRKVPGPFLAKLTRLWEVKKVITGNIHGIMIDLHKKHGTITPQLCFYIC